MAAHDKKSGSIKKKLGGFRHFITDKFHNPKQHSRMTRTSSMPVGLNEIASDWNVGKNKRNKRNSLILIDEREDLFLLNTKAQRPKSEMIPRAFQYNIKGDDSEYLEKEDSSIVNTVGHRPRSECLNISENGVSRQNKKQSITQQIPDIKPTPPNPNFLDPYMHQSSSAPSHLQPSMKHASSSPSLLYGSYTIPRDDDGWDQVSLSVAGSSIADEDEDGEEEWSSDTLSRQSTESNNSTQNVRVRKQADYSNLLDKNDNYLIPGNYDNIYQVNNVNSINNKKNNNVKWNVVNEGTKYRAPDSPADSRKNVTNGNTNKQQKHQRKPHIKKYKAPLPPTKHHGNHDLLDGLIKSTKNGPVCRSRSFRVRRRSTLDRNRRLSTETHDIFRELTFTEDFLTILMETEIENVLLNKEYDGTMCMKWCKEISTNVRDKIRRKVEKSFKIIVSTFIGARLTSDQDTTHVAVKGLTQPDRDRFITLAFEGTSFFIWITLCLFEL